MTRLVLLAALLVACSKKEDAGPPCDKVVDHMLGITKQLLAGHGDQELGDRKAMVAQCEQRKMPASQRRCLLAAKSLDDLGKCRGGEPPASRSPAPNAPNAPNAPTTMPPGAGPATPTQPPQAREPTRRLPPGPATGSGSDG